MKNSDLNQNVYLLIGFTFYGSSSTTFDLNLKWKI